MGKQWRFGKKGASGSQPQQPQPLPMDEQSISLYRSINELPLSNFKTCLVDNNLNALIKSGLPDGDTLQDVWIDILAEYSDAIGSNENKMFLSIYKDVIILDSKLKIIHSCVAVLEGSWEESIATMLNELCKTNYKFEGEDRIKELQSCLNRSKSLKISFDLKLIQFDAIRVKVQTGEKPTHEYFISMLIFLSNHAKYSITDSITVREYCERVRLYTKYCEQIKPTKNGRG